MINLHKDDLKRLEYIQTRINAGNISNSNNFSRFSVSSKTGITGIIEIFTKYPLKSTKKFDFADWKKAFELYHQEGDNVDSREDIILKVDIIREGMNVGRPSEPDYSDNICITKYWLLGFIEGEGSFSRLALFSSYFKKIGERKCSKRCK